MTGTIGREAAAVDRAARVLHYEHERISGLRLAPPGRQLSQLVTRERAVRRQRADAAVWSHRQTRLQRVMTHIEQRLAIGERIRRQPAGERSSCAAALLAPLAAPQCPFERETLGAVAHGNRGAFQPGNDAGGPGSPGLPAASPGGWRRAMADTIDFPAWRAIMSSGGSLRARS